MRRSGRWVRQVKIPVPSSKCQMLGAQCTASAQELYPMRAGAVVHRPCWFHEERGPRIARITRIRGGRFPARREATSNGAPGNNGEWGISFVGAAGICDGEVDWSMDLVDDAGNGRVRACLESPMRVDWGGQMDGCKDADPKHIPEYVEDRGRRRRPFAAPRHSRRSFQTGS